MIKNAITNQVYRAYSFLIEESLSVDVRVYILSR